ncbi:hypothetical protein E2542_SST02945 [Spatholobus suberectus]|nr:hypothetical protein E2542_SST02945 [Spatholobus suberectus]
MQRLTDGAGYWVTRRFVDSMWFVRPGGSEIRVWLRFGFRVMEMVDANNKDAKIGENLEKGDVIRKEVMDTEDDATKDP